MVLDLKMKELYYQICRVSYNWAARGPGVIQKKMEKIQWKWQKKKKIILILNVRSSDNPNREERWYEMSFIELTLFLLVLGERYNRGSMMEMKSQKGWPLISQIDNPNSSIL